MTAAEQPATPDVHEDRPRRHEKLELAQFVGSRYSGRRRPSGDEQGYNT